MGTLHKHISCIVLCFNKMTFLILLLLVPLIQCKSLSAMSARTSAGCSSITVGGCDPATEELIETFSLQNSETVAFPNASTGSQTSDIIPITTTSFITTTTTTNTRATTTTAAMRTMTTTATTSTTSTTELTPWWNYADNYDDYDEDDFFYHMYFDEVSTTPLPLEYHEYYDILEN